MLNHGACKIHRTPKCWATGIPSYLPKSKVRTTSFHLSWAVFKDTKIRPCSFGNTASFFPLWMFTHSSQTPHATLESNPGLASVTLKLPKAACFDQGDFRHLSTGLISSLHLRPGNNQAVGRFDSQSAHSHPDLRDVRTFATLLPTGCYTCPHCDVQETLL